MNKLLSAIEAAKILQITVKELHELTKSGEIKSIIIPSGQYKFDYEEILRFKKTDLYQKLKKRGKKALEDKIKLIEVNNTTQKIIVGDARKMEEIENGSINLVITSPPYFNAKLYSETKIEGDLGAIEDLDKWLEEIEKVWREVYRVLQPGRKAFINIMNLPVRTKRGFKTLNLCGKTIDIFEKIGFIFKRDIVWHKTNSVRAHFGTFPYPGNILINYAHEFILEFEKPAPKNYDKYAHLTEYQKEASKLEKEFWIEIKKTDVWTMKPEGSGDRREHVAPFPYELPYRLIKAYSYIGEVVLDPFVGSGTTLIAARDLMRNGIGYEINPEIAAVAVERIKNYQYKLFKK